MFQASYRNKKTDFLIFTPNGINFRKRNYKVIKFVFEIFIKNKKFQIEKNIFKNLLTNLHPWCIIMPQEEIGFEENPKNT